jgi:hypothetical protein
MCRGNGTAEGEPQAHLAGFGGEKRMQQIRYVRLVYAKALHKACHALFYILEDLSRL